MLLKLLPKIKRQISKRCFFSLPLEVSVRPFYLLVSGNGLGSPRLCLHYGLIFVINHIFILVKYALSTQHVIEKE